jgi:hypothetical protein
MNINNEIKAALASISLPVDPTPYLGTAKEYITFDYFSNGDGFADDHPEYERYVIYVRYYAPLTTNTLSKVKLIKAALFTAGFSFPSVQDLTDKDGQYWLFQCEKVVGYGDD